MIENLRRRARGWLVGASVAVVTVLGVSTAQIAHEGIAEAQPAQPPQVSLRLENEDVEVGEAAQVSLVVMWNQGSPPASDPKLALPRGVSASGPILTNKSAVNWVNGQVSSRTGFIATWRIPTTKEGAFEVGPATVTWSGRTLSTPSLKVVVRAPGTRPKGFDPFGGLFGRFPSFDDDPPKPTERDAPVDPKFSLNEPIEPTAFLRPMLNKTTAVVGEIVVLSVYLYTQPSRSQLADPHEPSAPDFFQRSITNARDAGPRRVSINGTAWNVELIRRVALFPLKPGHLTVGPMTVTLLGRGYRGSGIQGGLVRSSAPISIDVTEPPTEGRPQGYVLGDVGEYSLSVAVEPRSVNAGGSIAVTAILRGQGNIPSSLRTPEQKGVTWLDPEVRESIEAHDDEVGGSRTFTYVVKLDKPGTTELGELTLPFWSSTRQKYDVARVKLGRVEVTGTAPTPVVSAAPDPYAALPPPRTNAGGFTPAKAPLGEKPWFWAVLFGGPLLVLAVDGVRRATRVLRERMSREKHTPAATSATALAEATTRVKAGDARGAAASIERALVAIVDGATGIKLRGLLRDEVVPTLTKAGVSSDDAKQIATLLTQCETWRFESDKTPTLDDIKRTQDLAARLGKARR